MLCLIVHTARQAPPPAPVQGGGSILGGIGSTIAQGSILVSLAVSLHSAAT